MNVVIGALGAHLTISVISGLTSAINGIYTLRGNISNISSIGASNIKYMIKSTDLEFKLKSVQLLLFELKISDKTSYSVKYCITSIKETIDEIASELTKIHWRLQYNDNLWFGSRVRAYRFNNCIERLKTSLTNLDSRCNTLKILISMESDSKLIKNPILEEFFTDGLLQVIYLDPKIVMTTKQELYNKIGYITNTSCDDNNVDD
jgi:hypothetical protein